MSQQTTEYREELADLMLKITAGKSYRQIARDAKISPSTIGNMVIGRVPSSAVCIAVANAVGIEPGILLSSAGLPAPDAVEAVNLALRGTDLPEEGKQQIVDFARQTREKYSRKPQQ